MNRQSPKLNPYDVLEISSTASNVEITKAFTLAIKRRKYSPDTIALARKSLMNPQERIIADYLRPIIGTIKPFKHSDFSVLDTPVPKLELLSEFEGLNEVDDTIVDNNQESQSDRRWGNILFTDSPLVKEITQDNSFGENSTKYSHSFVKKTQNIEDNSFNSKTISILPWLSVLFVFLLILFILGLYNKFQYASSSQIESTPTEITAKSQISPQSEKSISTKISEKQTTQPQSLAYSFPLNSCGDRDPGGANSWYPVYIVNSPENLNLIQVSYCRDAIIKYREIERIQSIQVASFLERKKAQEFADLMLKTIGSGEVGESSVYNFGNKSVVGSDKNDSLSYQKPSPTQFVKNHYVNLSYGNYQKSWNQLSSSFKDKTEGYSEYVNWWNSVREIRIGQIKLIQQNNDEALVFADLTYITNTGIYYNDTKNRIYLIWDYQSSTWLFKKKF